MKRNIAKRAFKNLTKWIAVCAVFLMAPSLFSAAGSRQSSVVEHGLVFVAGRIGATDQSYIDSEVLTQERLLTFQDLAGDVWLGRVDPETGTFTSGHGRDVQLDQGAFSVRQTFNGPEFGIDAAGWARRLCRTRPDQRAPLTKPERKG